MVVLENQSLKEFNTFGIEAFAKSFASIDDQRELVEFFRERQSNLARLFILGGGSNVLFTGDYDGTLVRIATKGMTVVGEDDRHVFLQVAAGEDWDELVSFCVAQGWGGLENLSGIPGQAGSSPIQNIGAYGTELKDHFVSLEAINRCTGEITVMDAERCQFGYRDSIFKRALKDRMVIISVTFRLDKVPVFNLEYQALRQRFSARSGDELTLDLVRSAVLDIRSSKLPNPKALGNAGSFFKNPVVSRDTLKSLLDLYPGMVYFEIPGRNTPVKLAAGWLIEHCGWKGHREGEAGVHNEQALVLVNYGRATGLEILGLSEKIRASVFEKFGVMLEREVNVV